MKMRQTEYCHSCDKQVVFEFEDVTGNQLILCPNCGHQHYREIDEGTLTAIRVERMRPYMMVEDPNRPPIEFRIEGGEANFTMPNYVEVLAVKDGRAVIKGNGGERVVSQRRWGVDPRQAQA